MPDTQWAITGCSLIALSIGLALAASIAHDLAPDKPWRWGQLLFLSVLAVVATAYFAIAVPMDSLPRLEDSCRLVCVAASGLH